MATRDGRCARARNEPKSRQLHATGEPRSNEPDAHFSRRGHGWQLQDTVWFDMGTSWNSMRAGVRIAFSIPEPVTRTPLRLPSRRTCALPVSKANSCGTSRSRYRSAAFALGVVIVSPSDVIG